MLFRFSVEGFRRTHVSQKTSWKKIKLEFVFDSSDIYNRYVKYLILPALLFYGYFALLGQSVLLSNTDGSYLHQARDSSLSMSLSTPFPTWLISTHSISGVFLYTLVIFNKFFVTKMANGQYQKYVFLHRWVGRLCLLLLLSMDFAGFFMGPYSIFQSFKIFSYFFAAPWIIFCIGIYFTATISTVKQLKLHRLFGNMLLKACLATPFARLAGSYLQKKGWDEEIGYYTGIGGVSCLVGIWQCYELFQFLRDFWLEGEVTEKDTK